MQAQGWQPGDFLGAKDANHAEHYTAANASHIRVLVKSDNLGLGAKIGSGVGHGECTGLDAFKDLLGRLNGKEEDEIENERKSREDLKRAIYSERKWGSQRFVKGGFLVGDKILDLIEGEAKRVRKLEGGDEDSESSSSEEEVVVEKIKKSKKRKQEVDEVPEVFAVKVKKSKKERRREAESGKESAADDASDESEKKRRKKERREKRERKELKRVLKASKIETEKKSKKDKRKALDDIPKAVGSSTPSTAVNSGRSTPMMQGRHAVRSRNIAQKRLASMDVASINQVLNFHAGGYIHVC
jgi:Pin2-interacting protein X1